MLIINNSCLSRLLNRPAFAWKESKRETIEERLEKSSSEEARGRIAALNEAQILTPKQVLEKVQPRAASWDFKTLLDHSGLKRIFRLSNS